MSQLTKKELESYDDDVLKEMCSSIGFKLNIQRKGMINLIMMHERMSSKILKRMEYQKKLKELTINKDNGK